MRKLLLASVALAGGFAGTVSVANAEALVNIQQPGVIPGAMSPPGFGTASPSTTPQLPGTITVRLDARVIVNVYGGYDTGRKATVTPVAGGAPAAGVAGTSGGGTGLSLGSPASNTKQASYGMGSYARLYPQFVGVAANGLKYGAFLEIRQDDGAPPGGGANGGVSVSNRTRATLYFRREYAYLGTDSFGFVRVGSVDQPTSTYMTGSMENFDDGGWNGDAPSFFSGNSTPTWPFPDVGNLYTSDKIVYLSPSLFGFDGGISFEPSTAAMNSGPGNCPYGVTASAGFIAGGQTGGATSYGCDAASSTTSGDNGRRRNTIDAVLRYRAAFGPVGIALTAGGMYGGRVLDNSTPSKAVQFNNLAVFDGGAQIVFGGLTVGGHVDYGKFNGQWSLAPQHVHDSFAGIAGASYAIGPFIAGFHYFDYTSPGSRNATTVGIGTRNEQGVAIGSTYQLTQGVYFFASGVYGARHEVGVDLLSGATGATLATQVKTNNNTRAVGGLIGTLFKW